MTGPGADGGEKVGRDRFAELVEPSRPGLLLHCYRMLASPHDAEDAVQETMIRAWRGIDRFEGRSQLRTWLYTVATNVCLREIERRGRRLVPVDLGPARDAAAGVCPPVTETVWLEPLPAAGLTWGSTPTDAVYEQREAVELAFVAALQHLPPLQRAVLVLRDVLAFSAAETAESLDTTVASVTSALQRARASVRARLPERSQQRVLRELGGARVRETVTAFMTAWENNDVDAVVALLADDVTIAMPPYAEWYAGREQVAGFLAAVPLRGHRQWRTVETTANGQPAVAMYVWDDGVGGHLAHSLGVLTLSPDGLAHLDFFLMPELVG